MNTEEEIPKRKTGLGKRSIRQFFNYRWILKNISFFIFLSVLAVLYIANGHMADNRIRKINDTARQLKDLQYEYKTVKSEMMFRSKETEIVKAAEPLGLTMDSLPPVRIKSVSSKEN
ncbi:FtsL-like putative cell division protein [Segetibacter sp. 3557_3]|uniref:FtsL-like putative cell division protein n=1 Tax=Segetibacter sp. 3557_3 TaxID=2547429 RepID=UPI001A9E100A|nr:FtsL-like putative cell division protein [Segetibacter sp. 3557_3]